jgi:hypothetical protein
VNEAFLADLEHMLSPEGREVGGIGDVALKHFRELKGFENYKQYYAKREEAQAIFEREVRKTSGSGFSGFIDVCLLPFFSLPPAHATQGPTNRQMPFLLRLSPRPTHCMPHSLYL